LKGFPIITPNSSPTYAIALNRPALLPPALAPACVGGIVAGMKATFIVLLAVLLCVGGCGKKEVEQTAKETPKTKKAPEKSKPKADPTKNERLLWEFETGSSVYSSPAISSDGTVYVGSKDKKLYAIKTDSKGLAKSPWPMRGQNARHTGRVMK